MKENQTNKTYEFCPACRDDVEYEVKETKLNKVIKGIEISYDYKGAYCKECGEELLVKDLRDENLLKMNNAYREATNTISIDEILKILEKYNIGKRPLSIILGWGETTLTRFLDGDIPSKAYSDLLKKIGEDKEFFLELLEENEDKITSVAFKKCYEKTKEIDAMIQFSDNLSKIESVANYIIESNATVRQTARRFGISKSTVHKDVTERLTQINPSLASQARKVLDINKSERHIRGGLATKEKYLHQHI